MSKKNRNVYKKLAGRVTWPSRFKVRTAKENRLTKVWAKQTTSDNPLPPPFITRLHAPLSSFIITEKRNDAFDETAIIDYIDDDGELMKVQDGKYTVTYVPVG
jgi:hypothetical protein